MAAVWDLISHWGFDLLKNMWGCPDIHISSFSPPAHRDLDHMKTNRTADIRIQEAKTKTKNILCKGWFWFSCWVLWCLFILQTNEQTMLPFVHVCISSFTGQMVLPCLSDQTQLHLHLCICICACVNNVHCISSFTGGQMVGGCLSDQTLLHLHLWDLSYKWTPHTQPPRKRTKRKN